MRALSPTLRLPLTVAHPPTLSAAQTVALTLASPSPNPSPTPPPNPSRCARYGGDLSATPLASLPREQVRAPLHLPYTSPTSPLYLASLPREQVRALAAELQRTSDW